MNSTKWRTHCCCALFGFCVLMLVAGCNRHPAVTSHDSLELIQRFYTACNTCDADRLAKAIEIYEPLKSSDQLSGDEIKVFDRIVDLARAEQWQVAAEASLDFAEGQVHRW